MAWTDYSAIPHNKTIKISNWTVFQYMNEYCMVEVKH